MFFSKSQKHRGGGANTSRRQSCCFQQLSSATQEPDSPSQKHPLATSTSLSRTLCTPDMPRKDKTLILHQAKNFKCKRRISKRSVKPIYTANEHCFFSNFTIQIASSALVHLSHNPPQSRIHTTYQFFICFPISFCAEQKQSSK